MEFSDEIIKSYQFKRAELQLLNRSGKVIQSSTGFYENKTYSVDTSVLDLKTTYEIEKNSHSDQKIMAVYTSFIFDGQVLGILRYTTSLTQVDTLIINLLIYGMIICIFIAVIVFLISLRLGNMIVEPLNNIIDFTKKIAEGKYKEKIKNTYPNELGEIAKTLNYMGYEILKTDRLKNDFISVNDGFVSIKISDTGIGIKKENLKHVMESFYKIDPKSIGAGLGLAISRNIIDMHKGALKIDREYGKGTTVIMSLTLENP